jgi:crotonobetainyl-CoA:carnitine CoA-transferase CaiB-like acyl-CoA transferase
MSTEAPEPPLHGVRVLDLTGLVPGPFASQVLADLGATVIKVERAGGGDPLRTLLPPMYDSINRGKRSIVLDLKAPDGRDQLQALAAEADVLLEGFRPGVMDKLGFGFDDLAGLNPRLVYASLNSYGSTGPAASEGGHNENFLGRAGALLLDPGGEPGDHSAIPVADLAGSLYAVIGVLAALRDPDRAACHLEVPLFASALALMAPRLAEYAGRTPRERAGMLRRPATGVFPTADGHVVLAAIEDHFWRRLCTVIGRPDLAQRDDLAHYQDRFAHEAEIRAAITTAFADRGREDVLATLAAHGIPGSPALRPEEVPEDEQVRHWGVLQRWPAVDSFLPVFGLPAVHPEPAAGLDADGARVRAGGWAVNGAGRGTG